MIVGYLYGEPFHDFQITRRIYASLRYLHLNMCMPYIADQWQAPCFAPPVVITQAHDEIMTDVEAEEYSLECEVLKTAITSPDLFHTLRDIFLNHGLPDSLDDTGKMLYRIYTRLERNSHDHKSPSAAD